MATMPKPSTKWWNFKHANVLRKLHFFHVLAASERLRNRTKIYQIEQLSMLLPANVPPTAFRLKHHYIIFHDKFPFRYRFLTCKLSVLAKTTRKVKSLLILYRLFTHTAVTMEIDATWPVRIRHRSHHLATQSSHSVHRAGWRPLIFGIPWHNVHGPHWMATVITFWYSRSRNNWFCSCILHCHGSFVSINVSNDVYSSLFRAKASGGNSKARETRDAQFLQKFTRFALIAKTSARPQVWKCPHLRYLSVSRHFNE